MCRLCWLGCSLGLSIGLALWLWNGWATTAPPVANEGPAAWFTDVTEEVELRFVHDPGPLGSYFMPQIMGSGVALFDFDNDGRLDIYLIHNGGPNSKSTNQLFHQEADGSFRDVSAGSGVDVAGWGMGVAIGDVNNDGYPDMLLTEFGRMRLFLNNRNGTFTDATKEAGLESTSWGTSACFFDFDRDGWLDLVVANYLEYDPQAPCAEYGGRHDFCGPKGFTGAGARLYRNSGRKPGTATSAVRFEDVTARSGLGRFKGPGLGVVCADFTGDRWPDILVANDSWPNHLWINQKNGTFQEEAVLRGIAYDALGNRAANMGVALGDVDGDGMLDVYITHMPSELHNCWKQGPPGQFRDQTAAMGLSAPLWRSTGFGAILGDFDLDGALDIAIANGAVQRRMTPLHHAAESSAFWDAYNERNQLFANDGAGRFRDISASNAPFCGTAAVSRGLACGALKGDGTLSLVVNRTGASARIYRAAPKRGHWLLVRALDPALGGRDAYGAEVTVVAMDRQWKRHLNPGSSYLSSNDPRAHFGLGEVDRVEAIHVLWPDGTEERFPEPRVDQLVVLRKGEGRPVLSR